MVGVPAPRAILSMAVASGLYYGALIFLVATLGTNFETVTHALARANLVLGIIAVLLLLVFVRWTYRRLKR
jgi:membrane protein DedA with SNARE-associated domain